MVREELEKGSAWEVFNLASFLHGNIRMWALVIAGFTDQFAAASVRFSFSLTPEKQRRDHRREVKRRGP